jgi:hypothetical protein
VVVGFQLLEDELVGFEILWFVSIFPALSFLKGDRASLESSA